MTDRATTLLLDEMRDARARTLSLVEDLRGEQWIGPELAIVNPPLWEIGHVAWFQEYWVLRCALRRETTFAAADDLYHSAEVDHWDRWKLRLPDVERTLRYLRGVQDAVAERLQSAAAPEELAYYVRLATYHEDMHGEALLQMRQTLGYAPPHLAPTPEPPPLGGPYPGDVEIAACDYPLGAARGARFVFDNEKWEHSVAIAPFALARAPVTEAEFLAFVEDGGYARRELWSDEGWRWREKAGADRPLHWRRDGAGRWTRQVFDREAPLRPHAPMVHASWYEAEAFCAFAGRRLPSEAEWELAATGSCEDAAGKRRHPWGNDAPTPARALLDARSLQCADVGAFAAGDGVSGCRQMFGNVWEWTATTFAPYPEFTSDPYREYSLPWFHTRKVLRGGSFATRGRMLSATYRNFFTPDRRDLFAGFRTARREGAERTK